VASRDGDLLAYDRGEFFEYARRIPTSRLLGDDLRSVRPQSACWAGGVGWASGGGKVEGKPALEPDLTGRLATALLLVRAYVAGTGFEPV
jgi:hypothetical protein